MYGRAANGPGAMVIFEVPDPAVGTGDWSTWPYHPVNVELTRLFTMERLPPFGIRRSRFTAPTSHPVNSNRLGQADCCPDSSKRGIIVKPRWRISRRSHPNTNKTKLLTYKQ